MKGTLVLLLLTLSVASAYNSIPLPYQAHSMNDLDLMLQELLKGTSDFKFDVSLASEDSCSNYSLWEKDYSQCGYYGFGIKTCCLALRGDCSQQPVFQQSFNVTTDMLKLLRNPTYQFILSANTTIQKYARTKYFAFNFQYSSREVVATTFFIYEFLKTVKELNLNIKFVTGTTSLIEHYDSKCAVSGACNEMEQYIADSDIILQDKGSKQSKHRAVQFNTAATNLQKYCTIGFPSYAHKSELPMQLWEPSYQDMVTSTFDLFWSSLCPKTRIQDSETRFRITSNLNSEHIAVSLQGANKTTSKHAPKYVPLKHTFSSTTNSLIEHSSQLNATFITRFDITRSKFVLLTYKGAFFDKVVSTPQYFDSEITKLTVSESFLLVEQQSSNKLKIFAISPNDLSLTLLHDFSSSNLFSSPCDYLGSTLTQEVSESSSPLLVSACLLNQQIIIQTLDIVTLKQQNDSNNTLITSSLEYDAQNFKDIAAGRENGKLKIIFTFQATNPQNDVQEIFFSYLSADAFTLALENFTISSQPNHYGDHSSLRILSRNNKLYFIQVSGNGSSWSGVFMNNGDWSKCSLYSEQNFIALRNVPHTATYLYGQLIDLVNRIETAQFINSCDNRIISAKFYNGDKPSVTVIDDIQGRPTAYVLFNHVPYEQLPLLTTLFLGANNYEQSASAGSTSSTELVSFDLIEYDIFDLSF